MAKILLNYLFIYAVLLALAGICVLWLGRQEKHIILIAAVASAAAILLFRFFYLPVL